MVRAQRSEFLDDGAEFLELATLRRLSLATDSRSSVALGFRVNDRLRRVVRFAADPAIPRRRVNLTCERCELSAEDCAERAAPARLHREKMARMERERALEELVG